MPLGCLRTQLAHHILQATWVLCHPSHVPSLSSLCHSAPVQPSCASFCHPLCEPQAANQADTCPACAGFGLYPDRQSPSGLRMQVGLLYSDAGQFAKAGPFFSQALSMLEGELGPSHLHLANVCNGEHLHTAASPAWLAVGHVSRCMLLCCQLVCHAWSAACCRLLRAAVACLGLV